MEVLLVPADADDPSGPEVVHKTATLAGERERLLWEAEVLDTAAERGVRGVADVVARPSTEAAEPTLITSAVAGPSLAAADPLPVVEVAGVAAAVARLLAGLHEAGLVHGAVEPGHVVLDGAGGAILVGLGRGGHTGAAAREGPAGVDADRLDPAADVAGWGALVGHLLDWSAAGEDEPLVALRRAIGARPGRRHRHRGSRPPLRAVDEQRRVLAALADQAQDPDPARRPTARSLAAAVEHRIPGARMPGATATTVSPPAPPRGLLERLAGHLVTTSPAPEAGPAVQRAPSPDADDRPGPGDSTPALTSGPRGDRDGQQRRGVAARAGAASGPAASRPGSVPGDQPADEAPGTRRGPRRRDRRLHPRPRALPGPAVVRTGTLAAVCAVLALGGIAATSGLPWSRKPPGAPAVRGCPPVARPAADADGDGCEETVQWADGVLQAGAARFALGGPDDAWAVGDWDCDGRRTPALLHDGALAVFDGWPEPGGELRGRTVATAPGARGVAVVAALDGCDRPALVRPGAADLPVDPRGLP